MSLFQGRRNRASQETRYDARRDEDADFPEQPPPLADILRDVAGRDSAPLPSVLRPPPLPRPDASESAIRLPSQIRPTPAPSLSPPSSPPALESATSPAGRSKGEAPATALIEQTQEAITRLEAGNDMAAFEMLFGELERMDTLILRQQDDLKSVRATVVRLASENARLADENQQMRGLLRSILQAVEADKRRTFEAVEKANQRLRRLVGDESEVPPPAVELRESAS